jgi:OOP family OmpA-OmpF porin
MVEEIGETLILEGVTFFSGSAELSGASTQVLDEVVTSLLAYPNVEIEIQGHTDSQGASAYNNQLSQRRADAVRDYLVRAGIAAERITAKGYGERYPIATNQTEAGRAQNRRIEFHRKD